MSADLTRATGSYVELVHTMGTVVTLDVRASGRPAGLAEAFAAATDRLHAIDETFSTYLDGSWVSRLMRGEVPLDDCPRQVRDVVRLASRLADVTDGYFTPYWQRLAAPDPTGLVKGWAAQQAADVLLAHDLRHHVVNAAGDLAIAGSAAPDTPDLPWRVGISAPDTSRMLAGAVELRSGTRWAVATSGPAELGAHVVDPHTGLFPSSVASATTVVEVGPRHREAGAVTDACATALVAAGDRATALLAGFADYAIRGFLLHADGRLTDPDGLFERF